MEAWLADLIRGGVTLSLLVALWKKMESDMASLSQAVGKKADESTTQAIEGRLSKQIDKIEERQIREVEGLRTEMGDLRTHMDRRFDQIIGLLTK
jgi:demethoxyubiquinone hydroxylase (CLK1/Coq7/Cat5 family)